MTSSDFIKNFGARVLRFIESKTKEPLEQKSIRDLLYAKCEDLLNTEVARELIKEGRKNARKCLGEKLKSEIEEKRRKLEELEQDEEADLKTLLDDGEDMVFTQDIAPNNSSAEIAQSPKDNDREDMMSTQDIAPTTSVQIAEDK